MDIGRSLGIFRGISRDARPSSLLRSAGGSILLGPEGRRGAVAVVGVCVGDVFAMLSKWLRSEETGLCRSH